MRSFWWSSPGLFRLISLAHTCKQLKTGQAKHIVSIFPMEMVWAKNLLCSLFANRFCSRQMCWHIEVDGFLCAFQVFSTSWWMMAYGSPTPKRLIAMTNWMPAMKWDLGSLAREYMKENTEFQTASFLASCCTWKSLCALSFPILVIACICIEVKKAKPGLETRIWNLLSSLDIASSTSLTFLALNVWVCYKVLSPSFRKTSYAAVAGRWACSKYTLEDLFSCCLLWIIENNLGLMNLSTCRMKFATPTKLTDREMFENLELGDCWHDANMLEVWDYLFKRAKTCVPSSWESCMEKFDKDLRSTIGCWKKFACCDWCACCHMIWKKCDAYYVAFDVFLMFFCHMLCAKRARNSAKRARNSAKRAQKKKVHQMGHEIGHFCACVGSFWLDSVGGWCLLIHWPVVWACLGLLLLLQWKKLTYNNKLRQDIQGTI